MNLTTKNYIDNIINGKKKINQKEIDLLIRSFNAGRISEEKLNEMLEMIEFLASY